MQKGKRQRDAKAAKANILVDDVGLKAGRASLNSFSLLLLLGFCVALVVVSVYAVPIGPALVSHGNSTRVSISNATINESTGGGYIYTYALDAVEQNQRWKAYVGNVTGTLTLDDASDFTIYTWPLGVIDGEVYATRNSSTVSWSQVNCSWAVTGNFTNRTVTENENIALQHSRLDNISATFTSRNHTAFDVGTRTMTADSCYSIFPYVNDSSQATTTYFPEILLYDGTTSTNGKIVYAALMEGDLPGYNGNDPSVNETYDFQMLLPELGIDSPGTTTAYYFYVELT